MKRVISVILLVFMALSLFAVAYAEDSAAYPSVDPENIQPHNLYDYDWGIDSVTEVSRGFGDWRVGPTGIGPATLNINESTTISRTYTDSISGSYSIGIATMNSATGASIGVAKTHGTSYTLEIPEGQRRTILYRPKTITYKVETGYYRLPVGIIYQKPEKIKSETAYVTKFYSWDYAWRTGY